MKKIEKTNAARLLDRAKIPYKLIPYEFDENDLAAQHVADSLGQDIAHVFKTLVLHGDRTGYLVCVIPGNCEKTCQIVEDTVNEMLDLNLKPIIIGGEHSV